MEESSQAITARLRVKLQDTCAFSYLFGSVLSHRFNEASDIDLALYTDATEAKTHLEWLDFLSDGTDRKIDLILLKQADVIIAMQVLSEGVVLSCRDPLALTQFKAQKISEYIDFKFSRRIIEAELMRGKIYD